MAAAHRRESEIRNLKSQMTMWRGASKAESEPVDECKPLRETLAEMTANVEALIGAEKLQPPLKAVEELRAGGAEARILAAGSRARHARVCGLRIGAVAVRAGEND